MASLNEEQYTKLSYGEKLQYIKELACVCNECNNKWHYLDSVEKQMKTQIAGNAMVGLGMCCNPCAVTATSNANTQLNQQLAKLKSCPKCGSQNVNKIAKYFKPQK